MKVKFSVSTRYVGSRKTEVIEFEDDTAESELDEYFKEWVWENIDANFYIIETPASPSGADEKE